MTARGRADVECLFGDSPRPEVSRRSTTRVCRTFRCRLYLICNMFLVVMSGRKHVYYRIQFFDLPLVPRSGMRQNRHAPIAPVRSTSSPVATTSPAPAPRPPPAPPRRRNGTEGGTTGAPGRRAVRRRAGRGRAARGPDAARPGGGAGGARRRRSDGDAAFTGFNVSLSAFVVSPPPDVPAGGRTVTPRYKRINLFITKLEFANVNVDSLTLA